MTDLYWYDETIKGVFQQIYLNPYWYREERSTQNFYLKYHNVKILCYIQNQVKVQK